MPWDPMPHLVCDKCIEKLNYFNDFYDASLKAERFLRTLQPSAPQTDIESLNPVVEVIDSPILSKSPLKLPPKKRQGLPPSPYKTKKDTSMFVDASLSPDEHQEDIYPKRTLNCFIINQISNRDSVFTCRECFRTFTKQSSALTHSCVRIEDCAELESIDVDEAESKSLPPLKIRLFSVRSGFFVCYMCQTQFEEKTEVVEHIRRHILEDGKKSKRGGRRRGRSLEGSDVDDDWEEVYRKKAVRRKRKKGSEPPKKRGRPKNEDVVEECGNGSCEKCGKCQHSPIPNSPTKETMERTTQYSEISDNSEDEPPKERTLDHMETTKTTEIHSTTETTNNMEITPTKPATNLSDMSNSYALEDITEPEEEPPILEPENPSEEVTILEVFKKKTSKNFSSCVFCDKIFATKEALISHQNRHLQGVPELKAELEEKKIMDVAREGEAPLVCSICSMVFTSKKTLMEHEQYHLVDMEAIGCQRKIRIALNHESTDREGENECQISKGKGVITITVTTGENKIPQIELI